MREFETCYTVQTCIEHVHEENRILIQVITAEFCPRSQHTCSSFVIALATSLTDFDIISNPSYIGYDNSLNEFAFHIGRIKVKVTIAIFRKPLSWF